MLFLATGEFGHTRCTSRMPLSSRDKLVPYEILEPRRRRRDGGCDAPWWIPG